MSESGLFNAAVLLPPDQRAAFLDAACKDNPALRDEVESLLRAHGASGEFLREPAARTTPYEPLAERPGTVLGPYKLLQQIGEGGMGVVFMAEQQEPVRRLVAVKIIKPGMDSHQVLARFEAERQALALMDHPNIARVLDAGSTATGRPYFVMELVKGVSITKYCDENQLTLRERVELFVPVCQAVQHAHTKGIIHRDLKPSNVLIALYDDRPVPKVIDFGVAKATGEKLTERTLFTGFGAFVGTLEYMSPEQAKLNALDVDTRSDVYSLGVMLYELLTGSPPLEHSRLRQAALDEVLRVIREEEPPPPSTRLSQSGEALASISACRRGEPKSLGRAMRGELDWIVMRALEKDRSRRYETAVGLAKDILRYLNNDPVEACPPSLAYRARKLLQRNRAAVLVAGLLVGVLCVGLAGTAWGMVQAQRAAMMARTAEEAAKQDRATTEDARQAEAHQRQAAQRERDAAQAARDNLRQTLYGANLNLLQTAWEANNTSRVLELLDATKPAKGEPDLRGFEWHYWDRLCHAELRTLPLDFGPKSAQARSEFVAFSATGERCAALALRDGKSLAAVTVRVWDTATGQEVWAFPHEAYNLRVALSGDGNRIAVAGQNADGGTITVWDIPTRKQVLRVPTSGRTPPRRVMPSRELAPVLSHDGRRLAAFVPGGEAALPTFDVWDVEAGDKAKPVKHQVRGPGAALSPDGASVAAVGLSRTTETDKKFRYQLQILDALTGKPTHVAPWPTAVGPEEVVAPTPQDSTKLVYSPDGSRIAATQVHWALPKTGPKYQIVVWDKQGSSVSTFQPRQRVAYLALSANGQRLMTWTGERNAVGQLWDAAAGEVIRTWKGPVAPVVGAAFVGDGARAAAVDLDGKLRVWDATAGDVRQAVRTFRTVTTWSIDGSRQAEFSVSAEPGEVRIRDAGGRELLVFKEHPKGIRDVRLGYDGRFAVSTDRAGMVKVWDTGSGRVVTAQEWPVKPKTYEAQPNPRFSGDGRRLILNTPEGGSTVWQLAPEARKLHDLEKGVQSAVLSGDGRVVAAVRVVPESPERLREVTVWDLDAGARRGVFRAAVQSVELSPDGRRVAGRLRVEGQRQGFLRNTPGEVKVWDAASGAELVHLTADVSHGALAFSPDGSLLATTVRGTAVAAGDVLLWDVATGKLRRRLKGHASDVLGLAFSPDGRRLASAAQPVNPPRAEVKLWDVASGAEVLALQGSGHMDFQNLVVFSPDGRRLIAAGQSVVGEWYQTWDATPR